MLFWDRNGFRIDDLKTVVNTMLLKHEWAERLIHLFSVMPSALRRSLREGEAEYLTIPADKCMVVATGYLKLLDSKSGDERIIRLILGRGGLFGHRPFANRAFRGFAPPEDEMAIAHSAAEVIEVGRNELEMAADADPVLCRMLLESMSARVQFLERRLQWLLTTPVRARLAATLRDLICYEGTRCKNGHTITIRLTHQDLSELVGAARPVISAELVRLRDEGLISYAQSYFCVDNLQGLQRIASS
ncbi:MAG TPA: Crp/Fnr family transcriptional regulator [Pirellulales bacterium]|jgi:CRP-like cAMP-binding protein